MGDWKFMDMGDFRTHRWTAPREEIDWPPETEGLRQYSRRSSPGALATRALTLGRFRGTFS